jgi:hypothetical protein
LYGLVVPSIATVTPELNEEQKQTVMTRGKFKKFVFFVLLINYR